MDDELDGLDGLDEPDDPDELDESDEVDEPDGESSLFFGFVFDRADEGASDPPDDEPFDDLPSRLEVL